MRTVILQTIIITLLAVNSVLMVVTLVRHPSTGSVNTTVCYAPVTCHWDDGQHAVVARVGGQ